MSVHVRGSGSSTGWPVGGDYVGCWRVSIRYSRCIMGSCGSLVRSHRLVCSSSSMGRHTVYVCFYGRVYRQSNKSYGYSDTHQSHASTQTVKAPIHPCQAVYPLLDDTNMGDIGNYSSEAFSDVCWRCKTLLSRLYFFVHLHIQM